MKKNHRILLCVLLFSACVAIPTAIFMSKQRPQITEEQYERLHPGMTEEEVAEILGGPPADYTNGPVYYPAAPGHGYSKDLAGRVEAGARTGSGWCGNQGAITASFDSGKLRFALFYSSDATPTVLERVRAFLRLG